MLTSLICLRRFKDKRVRLNSLTPQNHLEAATGFEPVNNGFADRRLTTWLRRRWSGKRDLNPRLRPWQGRTLPLSYSRVRTQGPERKKYLLVVLTPFRNNKFPATTYSPTPQGAVPSALEDLTAVFGMETGVSPPLWSPETIHLHAKKSTQSINHIGIRDTVLRHNISGQAARLISTG
jgi:hypothetical protein